ncbi:MAG: pyridoxamine 5'-phosphate oxidase family protein [Planctomycetota bacterium]|jgi:predicted pyridoxine 5'-phosphate oxidase superfamily flavin-nucleotide-binding protein
MELPDAVRTAFEAAPHCFLATCHNGVPNVVPVGRKWIVDNEILMADFHFGKTRHNIAENPAVAISVTGPEPKQGFQLKGNATVHRDGEPFEKLGAFLRDAGVDATPHAAVQVSVEEAYLLDPGPNAGKRVL